MSQQPGRSGHVDRLLTELSVAEDQENDRFIATKAFPSVNVSRGSDIYRKYPKQQFYRTDAQVRAPGTEAMSTGYDITTDTYSCQRRDLKKIIADVDRRDDDLPDELEMQSVNMLVTQLKIRRELDWASKFFATGVWGSDYDVTASSPAPWDDALGTPIVDIRARKKTIDSQGPRANALILAEDTWCAIMDSPDFLERIVGGSTNNDPAMVQPQQLAKILMLDKVLIASAVSDSANEKGTANENFIMSDGALLVHVPSSAGRMVASAGYTFNCMANRAGANEEGVIIKRYRDEPLEADVIEASMDYDQKVVSASLGAFLYNTLT